VTLPETVPVAAATGGGATDLDALDDALVAAGVGNYNLVEYSSVVPVGASVERRDRLPSGRYPVGAPVGVVLADATGPDPVAAGVGWLRADEGGVFFEASGTDPETVEREVRAGLAGARERRDWSWTGGAATAPVVLAAHDPPAGERGAAVVVAVHGRLD
jgi:arginine decarboxylase